MTHPTGLLADVAVTRPGFDLRLRLSVPAHTVTAIVGPNGAGKSTALRCLAGLLRPEQGSVIVDGRVLDDVAAGVHLGPAARGIGVVFQDYLLFPHLTALDNVAFGPLAHRTPRREALVAAQGWLDRLGVGACAHSRPSALSGGQAQRVALARGLALEPALLLLDEPLSALDAGTRIEVRKDLSRHLREFGGATVLVTHDLLDALHLADHVVVLEDGRVVQEGSPADIRRSPATDYVARFASARVERPSRAWRWVTRARWRRQAPSSEKAGRSLN
ncbi:MAG: hypothetical protein RI885_562 [Actinomycetota bacterium]|jgi:molybdate transport system ATP-binding protein